MKKKAMCFIITLITFLMIFLNTTVVQADEDEAEATSFNINGTITTIEGKDDTSGAKTAAQKITGAIFTIIQIAGTGIALIILAFIGTKYMTASPDGKAELKKTATGYVVGAVVLFAASNLVKIIGAFAGNISTV